MFGDSVKQEVLLNFFHTGSRIFYKKGEIVIRPEDQPSGVYYIESGFVKAFSITKYGDENLLLVRDSGSIFPLIWVFTGLHREITYQAMENTVLWRVPKELYLEFLDNNPDVLPVILDLAIDAYRLHSERVATLGYRTVRERVASFLLSCCDRFGEITDSGIAIKSPMRQQDIASSINATRETTSRELNALRRKGILIIDGHQFVITDRQKLKDIL